MEGRITEEEYLKAIEVIKNYKAQIDTDVYYLDLNNISNVRKQIKEGDIVKCVSLSAFNKNFTLNKTYKVKRVKRTIIGTHIKREIETIYIINDKGTLFEWKDKSHTNFELV